MNDDTPAGVLRQSTQGTNYHFGVSRAFTNNTVKIFSFSAIFISLILVVLLLFATPASATILPDSSVGSTLHVKVVFDNGTFANGLFNVTIYENGAPIDSGRAPFNTKVGPGEYRFVASGVYNGQELQGDTSCTINPGDNSEHEVITLVTQAPVAIFTANPTSGTFPLTVQFTDQSIGVINSYLWNFGNGATSHMQNPSYIFEYGGTYDVSLTVTNAWGSGTATQTITVTGPVAPPMVQLNPIEYTVDENAGTATITVILSELVDSDVVVAYHTEDGTAIDGTNYTGTASGTVTIPAGESSAVFTVPINDDEIYGGDTQFSVVISSVSSGNAEIGSSNTATVTIVDDEYAFSVNLYKGWNLISCPLYIQPFYASELGAKGIIEVATYQKATNSYKIFLMGWDDPLSNQDFMFQTDVGYFVAVDHDMILTFVGKRPVDRTALLPGDNKWDLYGWSTLKSQNVYQLVSGLSGTQTIAKYNHATNTYTIFLKGWNTETDPENFVMAPGEGYFISSNADATINYGGI